VLPTLLLIHIVLGATALVVGVVAMRAAKRPGLHTRAGEAYHWIVLGVCVSAVAIALTDWARLWWFVPISVGSYAFALLGYVAAKRRWRGWLTAHVTGQGGSSIAMVTALLVVNWQPLTGIPGRATLWPWVLPTLVGTPIIAWVNARLRRRRLA
jgi:hypothetical protein